MIYWIAFIIWAFQTISIYVNINSHLEVLTNVVKNKYSEIDDDVVKVAVYISLVIKLFIDIIVLKLFLLVS